MLMEKPRIQPRAARNVPAQAIFDYFHAHGQKAAVRYVSSHLLH